MNNILLIFDRLKNTPSDINEHLETLKIYSEGSDHIVEMGVRWIVSTWAFLASKPKKLTSIDINHPSIHGADLNVVYREAQNNNIDFKFIQADTTKIEIEECDILFIDTWHVYFQLKKELELHSNKCKKYIILHDTETFGNLGESSGHGGLIPAIDEFLASNSNWIIEEKFTNNNGLTILKRI